MAKCNIFITCWFSMYYCVKVVPIYTFTRLRKMWSKTVSNCENALLVFYALKLVLIKVYLIFNKRNKQATQTGVTSYEFSSSFPSIGILAILIHWLVGICNWSCLWFERNLIFSLQMVANTIRWITLSVFFWPSLK